MISNFSEDAIISYPALLTTSVPSAGVVVLYSKRKVLVPVLVGNRSSNEVPPFLGLTVPYHLDLLDKLSDPL